MINFRIWYNPLGLARAFKLYRPPVYQALARQVGDRRGEGMALVWPWSA